MLLAILIFTGLAAAIIGGKALLGMIIGLPVIGPFATWYMQTVGELAPGPMANLIYAGMAVQIVCMAAAPLVYGPSATRRVIAIARERRTSTTA